MKSKFFTTSLLASALFLGLGLAPVMAQGTSTPAIDRTQQAISARIQKCLASGHITRSEARELLRRDREIDLRESRFKANGTASPQERQQLRADLAALGAEVERLMMNNDYVQPPGNSASTTPGIDKRQLNISARIDEGVRSGRINQREARRLHKRERAIARHEAAYKRDGVVTPQERRQLRDELARLNADLARMMRNQRTGQQ
jgi:hypothetical protein